MAQWNVVIVGFRLNAAERPARVLERVLGLSSEDAKAKTRSFPHVALEGVTKERADETAVTLREAGARVEIRPYEVVQANAPRRSIVLDAAGRKSLVLADVNALAQVAHAQRAPIPSHAAVAHAEVTTATSEPAHDPNARLSVYRLGELEVVITTAPRPIAQPVIAEKVPKRPATEPGAVMRPIGAPQPPDVRPLPAMAKADTAPHETTSNAVCGRATWSPGDLHTIDDTLNPYTDDAPIELDETALPHQPPKVVYRARGRLSIFDHARAYEARHRGTLLASIVRQVREGMVAISAFVLISACAAAALAILREGKALRANAQDASEEQVEASVHGAAESESATSDAEQTAQNAEDPGATRKFTRLPNARASFGEMRTQGLHRVAVNWPVGDGTETERVSCILLADPKPEDVARVRGDRQALEIPPSVREQLDDHIETLKLAEGRDSIVFVRLCLAEPE